MLPRSRAVAIVLGAVAALATVGCTDEGVGPTAPIALEQFAGAPALEASSARQTVVDFIRAYAVSPREGVGALTDLVAGEELGAWTHWLAVQHREFTGTIEGSSDVRDVEFVASLEADDAAGAQVGLSATVTFAYAPQDAETFRRARILDGPVTLLRTDAGGYRVIDLLRDGVPMSDGIQLFRNEHRTIDGVTVTLDSLFMFEPNWQFNVVIDNPTGSSLELDPDASGLLIGPGASAEREAGAATRSATAVGPGDENEAIVAFPLQDDASGRTLLLTYRAGDAELRFAFPLGDVVDVVPPTAPEAASGPTGATSI